MEASRLAKPVENVREEIGGDSDAAISHPNGDARFDALGGDVNAAAFRGEFERVGEQIPEDLLHPGWVAQHLLELRADRDRK